MHSSPNSKAYIVKYNHKHTHFYKLSHFLTHVTLLSHPYTIIHNVVTWHTLTCTYAHSYSVPTRIHINPESHLLHTQAYIIMFSHFHIFSYLCTHKIIHSHTSPCAHSLTTWHSCPFTFIPSHASTPIYISQIFTLSQLYFPHTHILPPSLSYWQHIHVATHIHTNTHVVAYIVTNCIFTGTHHTDSHN